METQIGATSPHGCLLDLDQRYPAGDESISCLGKRKIIIDSKVPAGRGYVSSLQGTPIIHDLFLDLLVRCLEKVPKLFSQMVV